MGDLENATAIGHNAVVDASNKIRLGNANVTVIEDVVAFTSGLLKNWQHLPLAIGGGQCPGVNATELEAGSSATER